MTKLQFGTLILHRGTTPVPQLQALELKYFSLGISRDSIGQKIQAKTLTHLSSSSNHDFAWISRVSSLRFHQRRLSLSSAKMVSFFFPCQIHSPHLTSPHIALRSRSIVTRRFEFIWDLAFRTRYSDWFSCACFDWGIGNRQPLSLKIKVRLSVSMFDFEVVFGLDLFYPFQVLIFYADNLYFIRENLLRGRRESSLLTFIPRSHGNYCFIRVICLVQYVDRNVPFPMHSKRIFFVSVSSIDFVTSIWGSIILGHVWCRDCNLASTVQGNMWPHVFPRIS